MFTMNYKETQIGRAPKLLVQVNGFEEKKQKKPQVGFNFKKKQV